MLEKLGTIVSQTTWEPWADFRTSQIKCLINFVSYFEPRVCQVMAEKCISELEVYSQ